jgi:hypothetical protein
MNVEERIDVHAHFLPPFYRKACLETGHGKPDGMPVLPVCIRFMLFCKKDGCLPIETR